MRSFLLVCSAIRFLFQFQNKWKKKKKQEKKKKTEHARLAFHNLQKHASDHGPRFDRFSYFFFFFFFLFLFFSLHGHERSCFRFSYGNPYTVEVQSRWTYHLTTNSTPSFFLFLRLRIFYQIYCVLAALFSRVASIQEHTLRYLRFRILRYSRHLFFERKALLDLFDHRLRRCSVSLSMSPSFSSRRRFGGIIFPFLLVSLCLSFIWTNVSTRGLVFNECENLSVCFLFVSILSPFSLSVLLSFFFLFFVSSFNSRLVWFV